MAMKHDDNSICPTRMARGLFGMLFAVGSLGLVGNLFNGMSAGPSAAPALAPVAPAPSFDFTM